jgi:hypothetical protein
MNQQSYIAAALIIPPLSLNKNAKQDENLKIWFAARPGLAAPQEAEGEISQRGGPARPRRPRARPLADTAARGRRAHVLAALARVCVAAAGGGENNCTMQGSQ